MRRLTRIFLFFLVFCPHPGCADEPYAMEKIVVSASQAGTGEAVSQEEIKQKHPASLPDIFDYVPSVDLRYRGVSGIQGDLSLRGSTFEEVAVLVDGIKLNDPQTGHYNLDLPLTVYDVEKVEIRKTGSSAAWGAGAFAGGLNIRIRKVQAKSLSFEAVGGDHALSGEAFSLSLPHELLSGRISFEHKTAKADRANTDFDYQTASLYLSKTYGAGEIDSLFGYQKKDYGADSFYSNLYPEEEEHTETFLAKLGLNQRLARGALANNIFLRRHKDKFILRRNNPTSVNYHTNYIYGLHSGLNIPLGPAEFTSVIDLGNEEINSTNLGKHARSYQAGSLGLNAEFTERWRGDLSFRYDHYQKWGSIESYNAGLGYDLVREKLKLKASYARSFRLPSFTELYYSDAANKGDANLKKETADNFSAGLDYADGRLSANVEGFLRRGSNLIDYTRATASDVWQATNLGRVDFSGVEAGLRFDFTQANKIFALKDASVSYIYQTADRKAGGFLSKYALDILQNQAILGMNAGICGMDFNLQLSYNQRYYGDTYIAGDIYIGRKFVNKTLTFEPFVRVDNFTDADCVDVAGVLLPGRWIKSGVKFVW